MANRFESLSPEEFDSLSLDDFDLPETPETTGVFEVEVEPVSGRRLRLVQTLETPADFAAHAEELRQAEEDMLAATPQVPPTDMNEERPSGFNYNFFDDAINTEGREVA